MGLLAVDTARARAYVDALRARELAFATAFLLPPAPGPGVRPPSSISALFDNKSSLRDALRALDVPTTDLPSSDLNDAANCALIADSPVSTLVLAAPAGAIVRAPLFSTGKKMLHVHPGWLPDFRGSTTIYYSLLAEESIGATALLLDENIDTGPIVARRRFAPPADRTRIDAEYDPWVRATLLADVLGEIADQGELRPTPQDRTAGQTFFIIHPVLKHLAILANDRSIKP